MNRFQIWWLHFRYLYFGDKGFEKKGGGKIPCKKCGRVFQSWNHFDYYDAYCEWCSFARKNPKQVKRSIQEILTAFDKDLIDWNDTKSWLKYEGIRVPQTSSPPSDCEESRLKSFLANGGKNYENRDN